MKVALTGRVLGDTGGGHVRSVVPVRIDDAPPGWNEGDDVARIPWPRGKDRPPAGAHVTIEVDWHGERW